MTPEIVIIEGHIMMLNKKQKTTGANTFSLFFSWRDFFQVMAKIQSKNVLFVSHMFFCLHLETIIVSDQRHWRQ
jgi:hypothetical protein